MEQLGLKDLQQKLHPGKGLKPAAPLQVRSLQLLGKCLKPGTVSLLQHQILQLQMALAPLAPAVQIHGNTHGVRSASRGFSRWP